MKQFPQVHSQAHNETAKDLEDNSKDPLQVSLKTFARQEKKKQR